MELTILYLIETPGQRQNLARFADLMRARAKQLFLVYDCDHQTSDIIGEIQEVGGECLNSGGAAANDTRRRVLDVVPSWLRGLLRAFRDIARAHLLLGAYLKLIMGRSVDLVVVAEDNVSGRSRMLVEAASRARVPALLLPFTIVNPYEAAHILGRRRAYQVRGFWEKLFVKRFPKWALEAAQGKLLRLPLLQAAAIELSGAAPKRPWFDNEGPAMIAVESQAMMMRYASLGFSPERLILTGSSTDDLLEAALRSRDEHQRALRQSLGLSDRPLLLCAFPPDQLTNSGALCEFDAYSDLVRAWTSALAAVSDSFAIVVRPHPRIAPSALGWLTQQRLAVCWNDTASLIPLCDLYVASISATIRWAIACGRPVVNYDVFQYRLDDYSGVPGIVPVRDLRSFRDTLAELGNAPERLAALTREQSAAASEWGCLDGRSGQRIVALADRLLQRAA